MNSDFVLYVHRLVYDGEVKKGGLDIVVEDLIRRGHSGYMFEFPLNYTQSKIVNVYHAKNTGKELVVSFKLPFSFPIANWAVEYLFAVFYTILKIGTFSIALSSDPLTTLSAVTARKIGLCRFSYFHLIDYSTSRFANHLLNKIYMFLLNVGTLQSDLVGVVTQKAKLLLEERGVSRLYYLPNGPEFESMARFRKPITERDPFSLIITCAEVLPKFKIVETVKIVSNLKSSFPNIKLKVLGRASQENPYVKEVMSSIAAHGLEDNVVICGHVSRETNYELVGSSLVGIALYNVSDDSHIKFGDSIKIREYASLGLAIISDGTTPTSSEMVNEEAGYEADTLSKVERIITKLFIDTEEYKKVSQAALMWAQKTDKTRLLNILYDEHFKKALK